MGGIDGTCVAWEKAKVNKQDIELLWTTMREIYGHAWTSQFGKHDNGTWLVGLSYISQSDIKYGLQECLHSGEKWPPTLPQFRRMCLRVPPTVQIINDAIYGNNTELANKLRARIPSFDRNHMSITQLRSLYQREVEGVLNDYHAAKKLKHGG